MKEENIGSSFHLFLYTDVVNSSDIKIPDEIQIEKIINLQRWILAFFKEPRGCWWSYKNKEIF